MDNKEKPDRKKKGPVKFQLVEKRENQQVKALVLVPVFKTRVLNGPGGDPINSDRSDASRLEEAIGLARAIDLEIVHSGLVKVKTVKPATLMGSGKVDELAGIVAASDAGLVIVDQPLTPVQQHNLEKAWNAKVLDRTGLILEIFGARARTREGTLQVELAHLNYQKGRLVRSWTHLERQRGGLGFVGGPGETQIEADRRHLQDRISRLEVEIEKVRKTRRLHRTRRQKVPHPVVALVGYTNAGKSTLFNLLTNAGVKAADQLFATLDPTLRNVTLPQGTPVIFSDTVGFISQLPTHLIAAFRATLEEVVEADLILHIGDISHQDSAAQAKDVAEILEELGVVREKNDRIIEVWNKIDLLEEQDESTADNKLVTHPATAGGESNAPIKVSALTGAGIVQLLNEIESRLSRDASVFNLVLDHTMMGRLPWIYENSKVINRKDLDDGRLELKLMVTPQVKKKLLNRN